MSSSRYKALPVVCYATREQRGEFEGYLRESCTGMDDGLVGMMVRLHFALLQHPIVRFSYTKSDGSHRKAYGTHCNEMLQHFAQEELPESVPLYPHTETYFDYVRGEWRCFRMDRLRSVETDIVLIEAPCPDFADLIDPLFTEGLTKKELKLIEDQYRFYGPEMYGPPEGLFHSCPGAEQELERVLADALDAIDSATISTQDWQLILRTLLECYPELAPEVLDFLTLIREPEKDSQVT